MINRNILNATDEDIERFDFYNDYKDTMSFLRMVQAYPNKAGDKEKARTAIKKLEKAYIQYENRRQE